jgi:hypothetical protein
MLAQMLDPASRYPTAFARWLNAADFALGPVQEIAIIGDDQHPIFQAMSQKIWGRYRPRLVAAFSTFPPPSNVPVLAQNRPLLDGLPTAYVCQNFICRQPVNSMDDLSSQLGQN